MERGRPKAEIPRSERLCLRLTKIEAEKISRIAEKKNITKTEAILQGIDLLIHHKPKKIASRSVKEILKERGVDVSDLEKIIWKIFLGKRRVFFEIFAGNFFWKSKMFLKKFREVLLWRKILR